MANLNEYTNHRSWILSKVDDAEINAIFYSLCQLLDGRGELNDVTIQIANNIAYNEYIICELQRDIALRGVVEEVMQGLTAKYQPNKSIDQLRAMTTATSKLYNDLKILPREAKEGIKDDELDSWMR